MKKRTFLKTLGLAGLAVPFGSKGLEQLLQPYKHFSPEQIAEDDVFWMKIRDAYVLKPEYINLESGYYSIMPTDTLNAYIEQIKTLNLHGSYYMRTKLQDDKLNMRKQLADFLPCPAEELIITRNTTESLDTVISGMDWKPDDEAIMAEQDYGAMLDMFKQQAKRYGIKNIVLSVPNHPKSDEEIIALYENAITPRTRLIMVSHMINITGQIMPVRKICDMAQKHRVKVMVDGAHAIGQFDFRIMELNCDYYGASLHKWLSVPLGAGMLYVRRTSIKDLWPMFADSNFADDDIRKLNHTGTLPIHTELTIPQAINFHKAIGSKRKEERLRYLQNYWVSRVKDISRVTINTPFDPARHCAIANIGIEGMTPAELSKTLFDKYKIWTVAIDQPTVKGCRITPGVFTSTAELDTLVAAINEIGRK